MKYRLLATLFVVAAVPVSHAQDQDSRVATTSHATAPSLSHAGRVSQGLSRPTPPKTNKYRVRSRYGWYGYYAFPYDSDYDQLEDSGLLDRPSSDLNVDRLGAGPTIFEYNGTAQPSSAMDSRAETGSYDRPSPSSEAAVSPGPATILVFRDGHQQEVENYVITGSKMIILGERTQKVELTDLDLDSTTQKNADRGIEFKAPARS